MVIRGLVFPYNWLRMRISSLEVSLPYGLLFLDSFLSKEDSHWRELSFFFPVGKQHKLQTAFITAFCKKPALTTDINICLKSSSCLSSPLLAPTLLFPLESTKCFAKVRKLSAMFCRWENLSCQFSQTPKWGPGSYQPDASSLALLGIIFTAELVEISGWSLLNHFRLKFRSWA